MSIKYQTYLPGDKKDKLSEIIRVNHSGELGAINIYKGQIAATKHLLIIKKQPKLLEILTEMYKQEMVHFQYFQSRVVEHKVRPSFFTPIWSQLGFVIGYITGILGKKSAMTLTVGVETIIGNHYKSQLELIAKLHIQNDALKEKISQFMEEELEHLDIGIAHQAEKMCGYFYIRKTIEMATKLAISIAKHI